MSLRWRILADDLTGALDTAAAFAGHGEVPVFLGAGAQADAPVQAVATGSRDVPADAMAAALGACLPWFGGAAAGRGSVGAFKKIDSLLRGNSFAEIAWLHRHGGISGFSGIVLAPAYPAQGRFTRAGRHWVGEPHGADTRPPAVAIDLVAALAAHGIAARVGQDLDHMAPGEVLVPDVTSDADLAELAALAFRSAGTPRRLWCGSAGLAWALARHIGRQESTAVANPAPLRSGRVQLVTASRHPVLRAQWAGVVEAAGAAGAACIDLAHPHAVDTATAASLLRQRSVEWVRMSPRPDILVVIGGDTLLALCQASGVQSLLAGAGPRNGWGCARFRGGAWDGVTCYSRSGAFGAPDDLSALLATLTPKETVP